MTSGTSKWKQTRVALLLCGALAAPVVAGRAQANAVGNRGHWAGTWAAAPQLGDARNAPPAPGLTGSTLRQVVHVSIGGARLRVRFSNAFGATPLTIASAHVALSAGGRAIKPETDKTLTFRGEPSVTIPPGAPMLSDPLEFHLPPLANLAVTIYLEDVPAGITVHPGSRETSYLETGDHVAAGDLPSASKVEHWYFLSEVCVEAAGSAAAIVVLGDSITDGHGSMTDANTRWPDDLARRLRAQKRTSDIGVLNEGIGGNRLLHDGIGPNALARFDRDVLAADGVRWLIVLEGINDIGARGSAAARHESAATAEAMITAYEQIILRAHAHGIRVYGATILPYQGASYYSDAGEAERQAVNRWIRAPGHFDGVIDMDAATRDPANPSRLSPAADSGDHLHPGDEGYRTMANTVNLKLFQR